VGGVREQACASLEEAFLVRITPRFVLRRLLHHLNAQGSFARA